VFYDFKVQIEQSFKRRFVVFVNFKACIFTSLMSLAIFKTLFFCLLSVRKGAFQYSLR